jgi:hypothetical protein
MLEISTSNQQPFLCKPQNEVRRSLPFSAKRDAVATDAQNGKVILSLSSGSVCMVSCNATILNSCKFFLKK